MLVFSRKLEESLVLPGVGITVKVLGISRGQVKLGIDAPPDVAVYRKELLDAPPTMPRPHYWPKSPVIAESHHASLP